MFSKTLVLSFLAATSLAMNAAPATGPGANWVIENYYSNCDVPGDCHYSFVISGTEETPAGPDFYTFCSGIEETLNTGLEKQWESCYNDTSISTFQEFQAGAGLVHLEVRHVWDNETEKLTHVSVAKADFSINGFRSDEPQNDFEVSAGQKYAKTILD